MSEKKVLILSYYWYPSGGAGVQRILKFVKYLPQFGFKPYIVTVKEEQASYPVIDHSFKNDIPPDAEIFRTDTREPFGLYSKVLGKKSIPTGFSNESSPNFVQRSSRFIRGNLFIPDARKGWIKFAYEKAKEIIQKEKIKIILSTSPPHSTQLAALKLKNEFGLKWIADLRDPWTDIYFYNEFRHLPFAKKKDLGLERKVLEGADKIITVSRPLKEIFQRKSEKIDEKKIFVIPNGFDPEDFENVKAENKSDEFIITYTGTIADSYKPEVFFDALKEVIAEIKDVKIKMRFIGNLSDGIHSYIRDLGIEKNIEVIPTVSHERSIEFLCGSNLLLLAIPDNENAKGILTGKLFEYLASRKQIVCIGPADGEAAEIISGRNAGKTFERNMKNELKDFLKILIKNWKSGESIEVHDETYKKFSRLEQTKKLADIISQL